MRRSDGRHTIGWTEIGAIMKLLCKIGLHKWRGLASIGLDCERCGAEKWRIYNPGSKRGYIGSKAPPKEVVDWLYRNGPNPDEYLPIGCAIFTDKSWGAPI